MDHVLLPRTGLKVSRIILGCEQLGGTDWGEFRPGAVAAAVDRAWDLGINAFDVADAYGLGQAETMLAQCLGDRRKEAVIITKFGVNWRRAGAARAATFRDSSPARVREALEGSLRRLRLDCIPLYLVHWPDPKTPVEDTVGALLDCQRAGKIRHFGVSNYPPDWVRKACAAGPVAAVQGSFSLLERSAQAELLPACAELDLPFLAYGVLAQGLLTGKYDPSSRFPASDRRSRLPQFQGDAWARTAGLLERVAAAARVHGRTIAQVAIRWVLDQPGVACAIVGARTAAQAESNAMAAGWELQPPLD